MERIVTEVQEFFERYPSARNLGRLTTSEEIEALPKQIQTTIPTWYKNLLLQFPIANLPLGIPNDFGQPLLKGRSLEQLPLMEITFYSIDKIAERSDSIFPNFLLFKKKIIGIAEDEGSTGEGIFIDAKDDDPPVIMIFHDMGESLKDLIKNGDRLSNNFSDLFRLGRLRDDKIKLTNVNREEAIILITNFFDRVDSEAKENEETVKNQLTEFSHFTNGTRLRDSELNKGEYVAALLKFQWGLYDSGYPLTRKHLDDLVKIYKVCGLHIPELVFIEERVGNYSG
jgi:hypothetical protein